MKRDSGIMTAAGAVLCALAIGFVMQNSETARKRYGPNSAGLIAGSTAQPLDVKGIEMTSAEVAPAARRVFGTENTSFSAPGETVKPSDVLSFIESECEVYAFAQPRAGAMVALSVGAECMAGERVNIHHSGMVFSQVVDQKGRLSTMVPALAESAVFIIAFPNGDGAVVEANVNDLAKFERVVLQRDASASLGIHAREFGADYGEAGHIWAGARGEGPARGSFLTVLGDQDLPGGVVAEVYSFPSQNTEREGTIDLTVETQVTAGSCDRKVEAKVLQLKAGGTLETRDFVLAMPKCDAAGTILQLNNLLQDLKIVSN